MKLQQQFQEIVDAVVARIKGGDTEDSGYQEIERRIAARSGEPSGIDHAMRRRTAEALALRRITAADELAAKRAARAAAEGHEMEARTAHERTLDALRVARLEEAECNGAHAGAVSALEVRLRGSASPRIDETISTLRTMHANILGRSRNEPPLQSRKFDPIFERKLLVWSATIHPSATRALTAIASALTDVEALKLEALSDEDLEVRLLAIVSTVPEVEEEVLEPHRAHA